MDGLQTDSTFSPECAEPDIERLAAFLFRLARDEVGFGVMEDHLRVVEQAHERHSDVIYVGAARPMGEWARDAARRLVGGG